MLDNPKILMSSLKREIDEDEFDVAETRTDKTAGISVDTPDDLLKVVNILRARIS